MFSPARLWLAVSANREQGLPEFRTGWVPFWRRR